MMNADWMMGHVLQLSELRRIDGRAMRGRYTGRYPRGSSGSVGGGDAGGGGGRRRWGSDGAGLTGPSVRALNKHIRPQSRRLGRGKTWTVDSGGGASWGPAAWARCDHRPGLDQLATWPASGAWRRESSSRWGPTRPTRRATWEAPEVPASWRQCACAEAHAAEAVGATRPRTGRT